MTIEIIIRLIAGVFLTLCNAFFVTIEFALTRLPQYDLEKLKKTKGLERAVEMLDKLEIYLTGCQLGITLSSILLGIVSEPAVTKLIKPVVTFLGVPASSVPIVSIVIAVIIINFFHKIFGEQAPTYLGVERPKQVARYCAEPHYWWTKIMYPVIYAGDGAAKALLRLFGVEMSRSWTKVETESEKNGELNYNAEDIRKKVFDVLVEGKFSKDRRDEIIKTIEIGEKPVSDILIKIEDVVFLQSDVPFKDNFKTIRNNSYVRYPLFDNSQKDFIGIVYVAKILQHLDQLRSNRVNLSDLASNLLTVPSTMMISDLIDRFQEERQEAAMVKKGDNIVGFVTATDSFEAIIGDLEDPYD